MKNTKFSWLRNCFNFGCAHSHLLGNPDMEKISTAAKLEFRSLVAKPLALFYGTTLVPGLFIPLQNPGCGECQNYYYSN